MSAAPRTMAAPVQGAELFGDIGSFLAPVAGDPGAQRADIRLARDPFEGADVPIEQTGVARSDETPTLNVSRRPARQLTAILIADDRPVAVIDGEVMNVGDVLPDGARVASIRQNQVSLLEKGGRWRVLTLSPERR